MRAGLGQHLSGRYVVFLPHQQITAIETRAVALGDAAGKDLKDLDAESDSAEVRSRIEQLTEQVAAARKARGALATRKTNRRKWGVSTKNAGRIAAMLKCAAPHLRRHPDAFNADPLKVATLTHTLTFVPVTDDEDPEPDGTRPLVDRQSGRVQYRLTAKRGHDRADMLTAVIPCAYDPKVTAREFDVFLDLFQPEANKRRTIQQYSGMSLTAQPVQRVMFHTGTGGNGKSVYLEVLSRVFGDGLSACRNGLWPSPEQSQRTDTRHRALLRQAIFAHRGTAEGCAAQGGNHQEADRRRALAGSHDVQRIF